DEREDGDQQHPVDERDIDLADPFLRGVRDTQPRKVTEPGRLLRDRERARDDRLRGDDRRGGGEENHRQPRPPRDQQEEGAADAARVVQDQGALPHVAEDAGGGDEEQPDPPYWRPGGVPPRRVPRPRSRG